MSIKRCEFCGKPFEPKYETSKTCGRVCHNRLNAKRRKEAHTKQKKCVVCGSPFEVGGSDWDRVTCSLECAYKLKGDARKQRVTKICETCGGEYEVKASEAEKSRYCSKRCMYGRNKARTTRDCIVCGKSFDSSPSQMHVQT